MQIGHKIRRLRKLRGLTIEELADKSNITKGFISQLERDLTVPSVITLKHLLDVLDVNLSSFFSDILDREKNIFVQRDRIIQKSTDGFKIDSLIPKVKYIEMDPTLLTLEPLVEYKMQFKEDEGFGFVVRGNIEVSIDDERKVITRGDCFYLFFDNYLVLKNLSKKNAEILLVNY